MFIENVFELEGPVFRYEYDVLSEAREAHVLMHPNGVFVLEDEHGPITSFVLPFMYDYFENATRDRVADNRVFTLYGADETLLAPAQEVSEMRSGYGYALDEELVVRIGDIRTASGDSVGLDDADPTRVVEVYDHPVPKPREAPEEFPSELVTLDHLREAASRHRVERVIPIL